MHKSGFLVFASLFCLIGGCGISAECCEEGEVTTCTCPPFSRCVIYTSFTDCGDGTCVDPTVDGDDATCSDEA